MADIETTEQYTYESIQNKLENGPSTDVSLRNLELEDRKKLVQEIVDYYSGIFTPFIGGKLFDAPIFQDYRSVDGFYFRAIPLVVARDGEQEKLYKAETLNDLSQDSERALRIIDEIVESERDIWKVHLTVPPDQKILVLAEIVKRSNMSAFGRFIWNSKYNPPVEDLLKSNGVPTTEEEAKMWLRQGFFVKEFKMLDHMYEDRLNSTGFIFYAENEAGARSIALDLNKILRDLEIPLNPLPEEKDARRDALPRFSWPLNEEDIGVTLVQGNGNTKIKVRQLLGEEGLKKYYQEDQNFAFFN